MSSYFSSADTGFWTADRSHDIALQYRFKVYVGDEFFWWAKSCDKPKINIQTLAKEEYYLGSPTPDAQPAPRADFQPIQMTMIDPVEPHVTDGILARLMENNQCFPAIDGAALRNSIGEVVIVQIDHEGRDVERWTLIGAFPASIDFGSFDYSSDAPVEITINWDYVAFKVETIGVQNGAYLDDRLNNSFTQIWYSTDLDTAIMVDGTFT